MIGEVMTSVQVWGFDSNLNRGVKGSNVPYIIDDSLEFFLITDCHDVLLSNRINIGSITLNFNNIEPLTTLSWDFPVSGVLFCPRAIMSMYVQFDLIATHCCLDRICYSVHTRLLGFLKL